MYGGRKREREFVQEALNPSTDSFYVERRTKEQLFEGDDSFKS